MSITHFSPITHCTKEMEEVLTAGKKYDTSWVVVKKNSKKSCKTKNNY